MKKSTRVSIASAFGIGMAVLAVSPALATEVYKPYTIVLWEIPGGDPLKPFEVPQPLIASQQIETVDVNALDSLAKCGKTYQADVYNTSEQTTKVLAVGYLNGANNPHKEDHVKYDGTTWKVFTADPCPTEEPDPQPTPEVTEPPVEPTPVDPPTETPVTPPVDDTPVMGEPELARTGTGENIAFGLFVAAVFGTLGYVMVRRGNEPLT